MGLREDPVIKHITISSANSMNIHIKYLEPLISLHQFRTCLLPMSYGKPFGFSELWGFQKCGWGILDVYFSRSAKYLCFILSLLFLLNLRCLMAIPLLGRVKLPCPLSCSLTCEKFPLFLTPPFRGSPPSTRKGLWAASYTCTSVPFMVVDLSRVDRQSELGWSESFLWPYLSMLPATEVDSYLQMPFLWEFGNGPERESCSSLGTWNYTTWTSWPWLQLGFLPYVDKRWVRET